MLLYAALLLVQTASCPPLDTSKLGAFSAWLVQAESFGPGTAVTLMAGDAAKLTGLPLNDRKGGAVMVAFTIKAAGSYDVALDQGGWIDVVPGITGGEPLKSTKHGHGPECTAIRKIVRFDLKPGIHRLYLSGLNKPEARVMLAAGE